MAGLSGKNEAALISKGLFRIVSAVVGPECIVKLRRQGCDIWDAFINSDGSRKITYISSGSRAEGFLFKSSDVDTMFVNRNAVVVTSCLKAEAYNNIPAVFLMETDNVYPGFAFIRCLKYDGNDRHLNHSIVWRGSGIYVSSKLIRERFLSTSTSTCHGPCQTITHRGVERDNAYTLNLTVWPKQAVSFLRRSLDRGWPSHDVLTDICKDGCLLIPINSKQQRYSDMMDLEWRISFSLAEKKLIYSMNHCQFLCYGLSKLFLSEILKKILPNEDLLCSYFMKTAVFWEISDNSNEWSPCNFLSKFWCAFRRLIKWVNTGYCPNFFIPENNMFYGKIYGQAQIDLLGTLRGLYLDGYHSLLSCTSLREDLSSLITRPDIAYKLPCNEEQYVSWFDVEMERLRVIFMFDVYFGVTGIKPLMKTLKNILMLKTQTAEKLLAVRLCVNYVLQIYAQNLALSPNLMSPIHAQNRRQYRSFKAAQTILRKTKTFLCMNHFLFIKDMYMSGNYQRTIEMIHYIKHKLRSQPYMYKWNVDDDIIMAALQQGMPYDKIVKSFIVSSVDIDRTTSIEELKLECIVKERRLGGSLICIPPLVFLNFLLFLSYTSLDEYEKLHNILDELQTLLYYDDGYHIDITDRAISWEILGNCQQLCGDRHAALESYIHALHDDYNHFKQATAINIITLEIF